MTVVALTTTDDEIIHTDNLVTIAEALTRIGAPERASFARSLVRDKKVKTEVHDGIILVRLDEFVVAWQLHGPRGTGPAELRLPTGYVGVRDFIRHNVPKTAQKGLLDKHNKLNGSFTDELFCGFITGARKYATHGASPWIAPEDSLREYLRNRGAIA